MADVRVDVDLDTKKAVQEAESFKGKMGGIFSDIAKTAAGVATGIAITEGVQKLSGFLIDAAKAAAEDEAQTRRLQQTFQNYADMVGASEGTFEALNSLLDERIKIGQDLSFSDDQVRDSFNALLTATDDSTEATKRQSAAFDLARGANIPLEQATRLLGKITSENVEVFKRMGITIGENATEADALAAVQARFGGQAEAYAKSTAGQFEQTKIRMSELKEQIGMQLLPIMAKIGTVLVEEVIPKLEQFGAYFQTNIAPKIKEFWEQDAKPTLEAIWKYIQDVLMPAVKENFAKFMVYYETDLKPLFIQIKGQIEDVVRAFKEHWSQIEPFVRVIFQNIKFAFETMRAAIVIIIDLLQGDWQGAWKAMKDFAGETLDHIGKQFGAFKDIALVAVGLLRSGFQGIVSGVEGAITSAINAIIGFINDAIAAYNRIPLAPNVSPISPVGKTAPSVLPTYPGPGSPIQGPVQPVGPGNEIQMLTVNIENFNGTSADVNQLAGDLKYSMATVGITV